MFTNGHVSHVRANLFCRGRLSDAVSVFAVFVCLGVHVACAQPQLDGAEVANQEPWHGLELLPQGCVPCLGCSKLSPASPLQAQLVLAAVADGVIN